MLIYLLRQITYVPVLPNVQGNDRSFLHMLYDLSLNRQSDPIDPVPYIMRLIQDVNDNNPNEQRTRAVVGRNGSDQVLQILNEDQEVHETYILMI